MSDTVKMTRSGRATRPDEVRVWDPLVRVLHWSLVAAFAFAFLTGDEWKSAHETAGYVIVGLVVFRILWGLVGPHHARFTNFVRGPPSAVVDFLRASARMKALRHIGHNPAGGAMVVLLLIMLAVITGTGIMMITDRFWGVEWVENVHEIAVNLTLGLVILHVAGVVLASFEHGENLARAMVTGRKRR
ncbi:cytochrome b/b6 domain-containing protein [Breoghania sp.]|uniref:cytochrome b/b6 domain-containing protein n=1 Tax=Breoghania sp. TaxID=2065378 RepID=UPI00262A90B0|nr:cytochrome b/b6 domain-containing protein [Breoghania sp.]MDJ0931913.1 cytochrome b/b6 domain-containing protein [Breoghania sp.]